LTAALELREISVAGRGAPRLDDLTLSLETGQRIALLGPSGAGKSTLIAIANGSLHPDQGTVLWNGQALKRGNRRQRRSIGTLWQDLRLVEELTVQQNVNAGALGRRSIPWALTNLLVPLENRACQICLEAAGLESTLMDVPVTRLSGGQRQRVAIARLIRQAPELVLADEPLASLDPALVEEVLGRLLKETAATVLISLHRPDLIHRFDRVIGLQAGRLLIDARPEDLKPHQLEKLYRS